MRERERKREERERKENERERELVSGIERDNNFLIGHNFISGIYYSIM